MKIIVAGTGYVGLVHAAVCSEFGHEVIAMTMMRENRGILQWGGGPNRSICQ